MKLRLLLFVLALTWLLPAARVASGREAMSAETARKIAPGEPMQAEEAGTVYIVDWDIQAVGHEDTQYESSRVVLDRKISITGSAVVHEPVSGPLTAIPMELTVTDDRHELRTDSCSEEQEWRSITDPGRYYGGPDPFWSNLSFWLEQRGDGSWYMYNPFAPWYGFIVDGELERYYNYRTNAKENDFCRGETYTSSYDNDMMYYADILDPLNTMPLEGDPSGTVFTLNTDYVVEGDPNLSVNFHATVRVGGGCKDLSAPIDISNPAITSLELDLQAENTTPDGQAPLRASVTCQGIPVKDAPVVLTMRAKPGSGGHQHDDGKRPRGYIDGLEITENTKFIGITDNTGAVTFTIEPGRDLTDKSRGIAGVYIIDAWVEWEGFYPHRERAYVYAGLPLVPLPESSELYRIARTSAVHPEAHYGTPETVNGIEHMAGSWFADQSAHNWTLKSQGKEPWPILDVIIWAVSLPKGGLFDYNAAIGGMWRPPFKQHRTGEDALLQPFYFGEPTISTEQRLWFDRVFRALGSEVGTWFSDNGVPNNLKFAQGSGLQTESALLAPSADPDVAAYAALVAPAGRFVAGAGQQVTYAVGVENLAAGTVASEVELRAELPAGLNFISADPVPDSMADARTPVWSIGTLPAEAAPRAIEIIAQVDPAAATGTLLTVIAQASSSQDADPANNQYADWGLTVQPPGPDLVIDSDLSGMALTVGEPVTFTAQLRNDGNAPAQAGWLELAVPTGITIQATGPTASPIPNGVRWEAGNLLPGEWQTFTVRLHVDPSLLDLAALDPGLEPVYPLAFTLEAGSSGADIDPVSDLLQVDKRVEVAGPDLLVALQAQGTPGPGIFQVGQEVTYTLRYGNFGNRDAGDARVSLHLWPGLTLLESQPAPDMNELDATSGVRTLTWNLGELAVGEEGLIVLRLRVDDVPEVGSLLKADISSLSTDLNPADNLVMETRYEVNQSSAGEYTTFLPVITRR